MTYHPRHLLGLVPAGVFAGASVAMHAILGGSLGGGSPVMLAVWCCATALALAQIALSWWQRAAVTTPAQDAALAQLAVTVIVPCYNEDPPILDRVLYAISAQTRLPGHVIVVDDGSVCDYGEVRAWWQAHMPCELTWLRQANAGKKHAQAAAWAHDRGADVYVTIDSDSALCATALAEGLKPFAGQEVVAVAGLEGAWNFGRNLLTRGISARTLAFQLQAMSAQSVAGGSVLICPGAFSLYRGWLIHRVSAAYVGETFLGVPVTLGDDTGLTMFALMHGKVVHQPSAACLNVYPETVSHHLRQWTRWMRASTIRTFWRLRYLPIRSYGWVFTAWQQWGFLTSVAVSLAVPLGWPSTQRLAVAIGISLLVWPSTAAMRLLTVRRSDQRWQAKLAGVALMPAAATWYLLVLRQVRFYGMATCHRQGWVTRNQVEVFATAPEGGRV